MKTESIRRQLVGSARKELTKAAGGDKLLSSAEARRLPKDLQKAVAAARKDGARVTVGAAVDAYASLVSKELGAVDKGRKGDLTLAEAKKISDLALRSRVLDVVDGGAPAGPGPVNRGQLDAKLEDLQEEWGSENIMDGLVAVQGTVVAGQDAKATALRDFEALKGDDFDAFTGARKTDGPRPLTTADLGALAKAINDDGFQYSGPEEVSRIRRQLEGLLKPLGGPAGLEVAVVRQDVTVGRISDTDKYPAQLWVIRNPRTDDAVTLAVRKGSL